MKKQGYKFGVAWIARNDNAGNGDGVAEIAEYVTVLLLADLFGKTEAAVAADVFKAREAGVLWPVTKS